MRHFATLRQRFLTNSLGLSVSFLLSCGLTIGLATDIRAQNPANAPAELKTLISQIEAAANQQNLEQVMGFFSPEFKTADGLTYPLLAKSLTALWKRYPTLQYKTDILSWEQKGDGWVAETLTTIKGKNNDPMMMVQLSATIKSRQVFKNQKLVHQDILSERTDVTTGKNPPQVDVKLPTTVRVGQKFDFDVIVQEPLGDNLLAGTAIEEKVESARYLNPGTIELQLLQSGGLFKQAQAPAQPSSQWLSGILVSDDGITLVTERVKVER